MNVSRQEAARPHGRADSPSADVVVDELAWDHEPPLIVDLGHVRRITLGSSSSGNADANSQYYW
jgi:hypothetical protein